MCRRPESFGRHGKRWRVGFYMSVLEEGEAGAGDSIERVEIGLGSVTVRKVNTLLFFDKGNIKGMKNALRIPALSPGCGKASRDGSPRLASR